MFNRQAYSLDLHRKNKFQMILKWVAFELNFLLTSLNRAFDVDLIVIAIFFPSLQGLQGVAKASANCDSLNNGKGLQVVN